MWVALQQLAVWGSLWERQCQADICLIKTKQNLFPVMYFQNLVKIEVMLSLRRLAIGGRVSSGSALLSAIYVCSAPRPRSGRPHCHRVRLCRSGEGPVRRQGRPDVLVLMLSWLQITRACTLA